MNYTQLTYEQRYQICALVKAGQNQSQIARLMGCHKSTISRELRRNQGRKKYYAKLATKLAAERQRNSHRPRIAALTWRTVERYLRQKWSPEQIQGKLQKQQQPTVSHERIYQYVYADKRSGGTLHSHLRSQKAQRKRARWYQRRGQIPNRTSIEQRPQIVAAKRRLGDWARHQGAILSMTERKSKLIRLRKLDGKTARELRQESIKLLLPLKARVHTITLDNGKEFCEHQAIATALQARIYFAHPYASWERGLNENSNGLIRQYFPKKYDFTSITNAQLRHVEEQLNNRPRKSLGYRTPNEVFFK
jgi:transposase, IS30 family